MAKDLASLPNVIGSRSEEFLNCIAGRNTNLNSLPVAGSRIEEYLEYLCHNGGVGGGADTNSFNALSQNIDSIQFKHGNTIKANLEIITENEITDILNKLT
ncbi:hypothetical protein [uncultured Clostridium sp.]|uniref:hypothetical protein n=1 Tax=uncultured Clostridium sp. TaxID=59620 RepID=UPI002672A16E|nr:hypothetical protein [uncultured Clostridium sp.]